MNPDTQACAAIRTAIRTVLVDFIERPFFDVREADVQARLLHEIRARLTPPDVPLVLRPHGDVPLHRHPAGLRTSRVHREAKLGEGLQLDLVVLAEAGPVEFMVHRNGPLDVIAPVRLEHLAAVVEVKAAPSKNMWKSFCKDLGKLCEVVRLAPGCGAFFVAFDKSLALGGTSSTARPCFDWLDGLVEDPTGPIEAHYVDAEYRVNYRRGRLERELDSGFP
jgi:hypothetical protein